MYLSGQNEMGTKGLPQQQRNTFGARIKIMWEEQLVDPPIDYLKTMNVP